MDGLPPGDAVVIPMADGTVETVTRRCGWCDFPLAPSLSARRRYCSDAHSDLAARAKAAATFAVHREGNAAFLDWRRRARIAAVPREVQEEALGWLRGRGHVAPEDVRRELLRRGWSVGPKGSLSRLADAPEHETPAAPASRVVLPPTLPCAALDVTLSVGVDLRTSRLLHGLLSSLHAEEHRRDHPWWSLAPLDAPTRWRVVWDDAAMAERLCGTSHRARLGVRTCTVQWSSALHRPRVAPLADGEYRVTVDTLTPVSYARDGHRVAVVTPSVQTIVRSCCTLLERARVEHGRGVEVTAVTSDTHAERVDVGGHVHRGGERGEVHALVGRISVRCNALAAWALTLARVYGLGGLTSQGFGRVRVEVESL